MREAAVINRRVMNMIARGVLEETDDEPGVQTLQASLLHGEGKTKIERMQNYGFSSNAPVDTEALVVFVSGGRDHGVVVATDHRASRFTGLGLGEVAMYSQSGDSIVLKEGQTIEVTTKIHITRAEEGVQIEATETYSLKTKAASIEAGDGITFKGDLSVDGNITATGSITGNPRERSES